MTHAKPRPEPWPDFLAKYERYQSFMAEKAELNRKKQVWSKKRRLTPEAPKTAVSRGAPKGNRNAYKHGFYTRETAVIWAMMRAFLRATAAPKRSSDRPRSATGEGL